MSFFEKLEVWKEEYLLLKYIFLNFEDYKNLGFNFPIGLILLFSIIAFPIAVFFITRKKNTVTFVVKQLLRHEALNEESAKTLSELRLSKIKSLRKMLFSVGQLSSMIKTVGYKKPSYEEYVKAKKEKTKVENPNLDEIKIFISEDGKEKAQTIAESEITPFWKPILISFVGIIIITILFICMPEILNFLNNSL